MEKKNKKEDAEIIISEDDVWNVVNFARAMYNNTIYGTSYLNPEIVSGRMKDITMNPMQATQDKLDSAMQTPKAHEKELQAFSQDFELRSMVYKRLISYLANMLSFDITYTSNVKKEDYKSLKFRKDLEAVESFLDRFEYKKEFRSVIREMLRNDAYFGCFREDTGGKYILQELPSEYCKITGRWEGGFLFSFNMYWFLQPGVFIDGYPDFFKKKYNEIFGKGKLQNYNPSLPPEYRGDSSWIYWIDIPVNFGVCFKLSPEIATRLPYFTPVFNDLILQTLMRNLQKNMNMAAASKMIVGEVPMLNKETKATVKDSIAISPDLLGKFMALVKNAISESIKVASAPLNNISPISFETDNEMYDSYLRTSLASTGVNSNLLFSSDIKPNAIETQLSLNTDEQMMTVLYEQFNSFMDYRINKHTKSFTFSFAFEGTDFFLNREIRFTNAMELFDKGIVLPQKIAASIGMKPAELRRHMEESSAMGFMDMLTPPSFEQQKEMTQIESENAEKQAKLNADLAPAVVKTPTSSTKKPASKPASKTGETGRPRKKLSQLGDEGVTTRTQGTNISRGGKV